MTVDLQFCITLQVIEAVNELQAEMQKVESQILSSGSEVQLAQTRLDILAQRLNYELCLDQVSWAHW